MCHSPLIVLGILSEIAYPGIHNAASPKNRSYLTSTLSLITHLSKSALITMRVKNNSVSSDSSVLSIGFSLIIQPYPYFSVLRITNQRTRLRHIAISSAATLDTGSIRVPSSTYDFLLTPTRTLAHSIIYIILFFLLCNSSSLKDTSMNFG